MENQDTKPVTNPPAENGETVKLLQPPLKKKKLICSLDVEPFLFIVMLSYGMRSVVQQNLIQEKSCLSFMSSEPNITENMCHNFNNFSDIKDRTQIIGNNFRIYETLIQIVPSSILSLFIGPWSDKYGRKIPIIMGAFGLCLSTCFTLVNVICMNWPAIYILVSSIPDGIFGGIVCLFSCTYSHLSETTTANLRVIRYAILELSFVLGLPIGTIVAGYIYNEYGYAAVYITSATGIAVAILWVIVFVRDKPKPDVTWRTKRVFFDLFNCQNVIENVKTCTKPRGRYLRKELLLMMAAMSCTIICYMAMGSITYFYTQKMYNWGVTQYSNVHTILSFSQTALMVVSVPLLTKCIKLKDVTLGIVGIISMIAGNIGKGLSFKPWMFIGGSVLGAWSGIAPIAIRSRISKIVQPEELGKVFSVLSSTESLMPIAGNLLFAKIYNATLEIFPGTVYFVGGGIAVIPLFIFIWLALVARSPEYHLLENGPSKADPHIQSDDSKLEDANGEKPIIY